MRERKIGTHFRIEPHLFYQVKLLSEKECRTIASIYRQAIKEFLERRGKIEKATTP
jgi:predicted transcriptional regulator